MAEEIGQEIVEEISEKERERRRKISEYRKKVLRQAREKARVKGYKAYVARLRREIRKRKTKERHEKEKLARKKEKERLKRLKEKKKRKPGRPKKLGRPKKYKRKSVRVPKKPGRKKLPPYNYKIISCRNGRQNKLIGKYRDIKEAYSVLNQLKEENKNVIFPNQIAADFPSMENAIFEYVLIEKNDDEVSVFRNEYGKFIEQRTNQKGWKIIDKVKYDMEETFWVWGYDKKKDRKTITWIFDNLLYDGIETRYDYKRIILFRNKIIFKYDSDDLDIVFCKCESDAVRLYNKLQEKTKKDKSKQIFFLGNYDDNNFSRKKALEDKIIEMTGWTRKKVQMRATTYYNK